MGAWKVCLSSDMLFTSRVLSLLVHILIKYIETVLNSHCSFFFYVPFFGQTAK